jgi:hypothetical protein
VAKKGLKLFASLAETFGHRLTQMFTDNGDSGNNG